MPPTPSATDAERQAALQARGEIPRHIACIMDGNGRWARQRGRSRVVGHRHGVDSVRDVVEACGQLGVRYLTLYTFSTENWGRPRTEVTALMELLVRTLRKEAERLHKNGVRLLTLGDIDRLPPRGRREMAEAEALTRDNDGLTLTLALSYSGRWEIADAARRLAAEAAAGRLRPEDLTEEAFAAALQTGRLGIPDPDLLVRTGGDVRVSNYLLWQIAYAEIHVTERFWPDFRREALYEAIASYQDRDRRFGRVAEDAAASL